MSDKITQAREFLKSYLEKTNTTIGEHSAVSAMADYLDAFGGGEKVEATETPEYKELHETWLKTNTAYEEELVERKAAHENDIKQRDFNWSELQKTKTEIKELHEQIASLTTDGETETSGSVN